MRRHSFPGLIAALSMLFAGCEKTPDVALTDEPKKPVVVFVAFKNDALLRDFFTSYSEETGVRVVVRHGMPRDVVTDVIENRVSPTADVLVAGSVVDIWRAAEEGALRPLSSNFANEKVPQWLRDPDRYWVAMSYQTAVLAYDPEVFDESELAGAGSPHESTYDGQLCLSSSANPINRAVIAMLIAESGVQDTQNLVRGWMANLARPVFDTDYQLLAAIDSGDCGIGIVSSHAAAQAASSDADVRFRVHEMKDVYAVVEAVGIARHAHNPDGAIALMEWMLNKDNQRRYVSKALSYAASDATQHVRNVSLVAWHEDEAIKLAERVQYRK